MVTHSPQIAAMGKRHFSVSKTASSNETFGSLEELDSKTRVDEIARMLAGKKVTENFIDSAKELLKAGR